MSPTLLRSAHGPDPDEPHGRADLHIHTLASDGVSGIEEVLASVMERTQLDVIAIADHERVDAAHAARAIARARDLPVEVVIGEEVSTRGGHLLALFIEEPIPPLRSLRESIGLVHEQGGLAIPAHPLFPYPMCAQAWALRRLLAVARSARPARRGGGVQPHDVRAAGPPAGRRLRRGARPGRGRQQRRPRGGERGHRLDHLPRAHRRGRSGPRSCEHGTGWHGSFHGTTSQLPTFGRQLRKYGRDARAEVLGARPPRRHRARPGLPRRNAPTAAPRRGRARGAAGGGRAVKIGLVTPYVYPLPGGVNDHVGQLYESLRARGHDVRILTASHGLQRSSEGDVIRIGKGFSVPANGSVGTLTISPRYRSQVQDVLDREQFDLLHFHEPFVPFLTLVALRESRSVNVATFHAYAGYAPGYQLGGRMLGPVAASRLHGRIAVSAAARHFADRYLPGDYKVIPNGVDLRLFAHAVPLARWQDGRPNVLFVGRIEPRKGLLRPAEGLPHRPQGGRRLPAPGGRLGAAGARGTALRDDPPPGGVEFLGRVSDQEKVQLFKTADVYVSPATGRESFGIVLLEAMAAGTADRLQRHPRLQGRREARRAGPPRAAGRPPGAGRARSSGWSATRTCGRAWAESGLERVQEFGWDRIAARVEAYYGFVIRRLAAQGALPPHFRAEVPPDPRTGLSVG